MIDGALVMVAMVGASVGATIDDGARVAEAVGASVMSEGIEVGVFSSKAGDGASVIAKEGASVAFTSVACLSNVSGLPSTAMAPRRQKTRGRALCTLDNMISFVMTGVSLVRLFVDGAEIVSKIPVWATDAAEIFCNTKLETGEGGERTLK